MRTVKAKLAVLVTTAVVSSVLLVTLASAWTDAGRRLSEKRAEVLGIAAAIATAVAHPLSTGDVANVSRTLSAIGRIPGLTFARVTDANGKAVQQYGFGVVVTRDAGAVTANPEIGPFNVLHLATYPVAVDIVSGGVAIGKLTLIADLSDLRGAFLQSLVWSLLAGLAAGATGLVLTNRLQRGITDPVSSLTMAMDEVSRTKDFTRQVPKTSHDEIGRLVDSFNGMLLEVRARDSELAEHRDHLEAEVKERTSELLDAKLAAEAASAAKSEFLATMSHEIRTPMNGMLVMAEMIATGALTPRMQRYADVLLSSGQTLLAIINDILDFSKIEAGKLELERIPLDLRRVIDDTLKLFGERANAKGLELAAIVSPDVPLSIAADPVRLTQVLSNLVNNALKFTESGSITVRAEAHKADAAGVRFLDIQVRDTGIGIPEDKLATIFDAFSQADQSTTRRFGGTGIGLTICRRLVSAMSGSIEVASENGKGSVFTVRIPADVLSEFPPPVRIADGQNRRIAIAIAEPAARDILRLCAMQRGLEALIVAPDRLAAPAALNVRAVIASAADVDAFATGIAAWRRGSEDATVAVISRLGDACAAKLQAIGIADAVLEQPLSSVELGACFDAVVSGRKVAANTLKPASDAPDASPDLARFHGLRILAADDNAVNREVLSEALGRLNVKLTCVENGLAALEAAKTGGFDLVLMDCSMPVMDGFEATRQIRDWEQASAQAPLPVVALTAYVVGEAANAWREAGMSGYLTKPYTLKSLRECLERSVSPEWCARDAQQPVSDNTASGVDGAGVIAQAHFSEAPLIDRTVLSSIRDMQAPGDTLVERIVQLYAQHAPKALASLLELEQSENSQSIASAAHALRSLSRNMGADRVAGICTQIEDAARRGDLAGFSRYCQSLTTALPATIAELQAETLAITALEPQQLAS